jgi:hypothetical protein
MHDALPPAVTLRQAILSEKEHMAAWMIKKLKQEEQRKKGAGLELWKKFIDSADVADAVKQIGTIEEVYRLIEDVLPVYDELAKLAALPRDQFDAKYPEFKSKTRSAHLLAAALLPAIDKIRAKDDRNQARMAMLLAAIAVAEGGPDKLKDIRDPFGAGPFEYRALDHGFELKSKLIFEEKPVTLTVGRQKKE